MTEYDKGREKSPIQRYMHRCSVGYSIAAGISIILLVAVVAYIFMAYRDYITYSNFSYLIRDFDVLANGNDDTFTSITYEQQTDTDFVSFHGGLAVAGKEKFLMYDPSGLLLAEDSIGYSEPVIVPSEKYLLVYDLSGKSYSVYNSLTRIVSRTTDFKITDAAMSDTGSFVLVTRSNETKYVVEVYNDALNKTMSIYKDNYVTDTAISSDGKRIMVVSAVPTETDFSTEICLYEKGSTDTVSTLTHSGVMPLYCRVTDNGYVVICDTMMYFISFDGDEINSVNFSGMTLRYGDISSSLVVISGSTNALGTSNKLLVYSTDGVCVYASTVNSRIREVCAPKVFDSGAEDSEKTIAFIRTTDSVYRLTADGAMTDASSPDNTDFSLPSANDILDVCSDNGTGAVICTATEAYHIFS